MLNFQNPKMLPVRGGILAGLHMHMVVRMCRVENDQERATRTHRVVVGIQDTWIPVIKQQSDQEDPSPHKLRRGTRRCLR